MKNVVFDNINLTVLKIGGSCLTYKKEGIRKIRKGFLDNLAKSIKNRKDNYPLVIAHGGGSITHPLFDRYKITDSFKNGKVDSPKEKVSAARIHLAMSMLDKAVVKCFLDWGIPAWPIKTSVICPLSRGRVRNFYSDVIKLAIKKGFVPVIHGDVAFDYEFSNAIFSGDLAACLVAKELKASRIFFASDVEGVYLSDPKLVGKKRMIKRIDNIDFLSKIETGEQFDHSGGMTAKLDYIRKYCKNIEAVVFNGLKKENFRKVFDGEKIGTIINFQ